MDSKHLKLDLLENAFDFLNCSIEHISKGKNTNDKTSWKHAIINLVFCIELLLKEYLRREHQLLIYQNLDKFRAISGESKTVDWGSSISRCKHVIGEDRFKEIDLGRLNLGNKMRNAIIHYQTDLSFPEVYYQLANLMNFAVQFYESFLRRDEKDFLILHIEERLKQEENELCHAFAEECEYFNGIFMSKFYMEEILEEQKFNKVIIDGVEYNRIPYGDEREWQSFKGIDGSYANELCHDCLVKKGQIHTDGCDVERCPKCGKQMLMHDCSKYQFERLKGS